jgi:uncharacterized protein YdaU (DUF1376 family)
LNYYEHHLGDYLRDTAHLSMIEDGAYRRLLDAYYIREAPLPLVLRDVYRLVRASSKQDREAVETVLREFFTESPDGWRHSRCDREIAGYQETIPDREARRENDRERQRRARDRRKALFEHLRGHDIVPPFDTKTSELEAILSRVTGGELSQRVTHPVTRDNTATQTPDTRHQTPEEKNPPAARVPPTAAPRAAKKCPPGFELTTELRQWAASNHPGVDVEHETAKFRDHTFATARSDWAGTWRNWIRKAAENAVGRNGTSPRPTATDRRVSTIEALTGKDRNHATAAHRADDGDRTVDVVARLVP